MARDNPVTLFMQAVTQLEVWQRQNPDYRVTVSVTCTKANARSWPSVLTGMIATQYRMMKIYEDITIVI